MVKHSQIIRRQTADELFECVWPLCGVGVEGVIAELFNILCWQAFLVLDHFRYFSILVLVNLILSMLRIERQNLRLVYSLHKSRKLSNIEGPPWKTEQLNGTILYETSYMTHSCLNFSLLFARSYKFISKNRLFLIFLFNSYERNNYYHKTVFESTCDLKIVNSIPIIPSFSLKRLGWMLARYL